MDFATSDLVRQVDLAIENIKADQSDNVHCRFLFINFASYYGSVRIDLRDPNAAYQLCNIVVDSMAWEGWNHDRCIGGDGDCDSSYNNISILRILVEFGVDNAKEILDKLGEIEDDDYSERPITYNDYEVFLRLNPPVLCRICRGFLVK